MTNEELRTIINERASIDPEFAHLVEIRNDVEIATKLSEGRTKIVTGELSGYGTILAMVPRGGDLMELLASISESDPEWKWAFKALQDRCFDFGLPKVLAGWDALAAASGGALAPDQVTALKAIPVVEDPITYWQISAALGGAE